MEPGTEPLGPIQGRRSLHTTMESFNPTPEWVGQLTNGVWAYAEVWGFPVIFGAAAFVWAAPKVRKSMASINKAEYEIASPIDDDVRAARERFQQRLNVDAAAAEKERKEQEEERRKEKLEELKNGPKGKGRNAKGSEYSPLMANSEGPGAGRLINRGKPDCPGGG